MPGFSTSLPRRPGAGGPVRSDARRPSEMELNRITQDEPRRLASLGGPGRRVLSLYLRLDPRHAPTGEDRAAQLRSMLDDARRKLAADQTAPSDADALDACVQRVEAELDPPPEIEHDVRSVAIFCVHDGPLLSFALDREPESLFACAFGERPALEHLVEALPGPRWAVVLASRDRGRILVGTETSLHELDGVDDEVHRWHSQGGWSQARYQRGIEKEEHDHLRRLCDRLAAVHKQRPIERLAVGGPREIWPRVDHELHPYLQDVLVGHFEIDTGHANVEEVAARIGPLAGEDRERREREFIERVRAGLGTGSRSVAGIEGVLDALGGRRVSTLLVSRGASEDRFERAVEEAEAQAADVVVVEDEELESLGRIAALLRY